MQSRFEYRTEHFPEPPSATRLHPFTVEGWRLVSVTVDMAGALPESPSYVVYLERPFDASIASMVASVPMPSVDRETNESPDTLNVVAFG